MTWQGRFTLNELRELLIDLEDYLDQRADVEDGDYGEPRPNTAMRLGQEVTRALTELESGPILP